MSLTSETLLAVKPPCGRTDAVSEVPDEIYEMTQLTELRIKNNPLPDEVYKKLAEALPNTKIY